MKKIIKVPQPINKEEYKKSQIIEFNENFYLKKDCVKINFKYYHPEDPSIIYNDFKECYEKKTKEHIFGLYVKQKDIFVGVFKKNIFSGIYNNKNDIIRKAYPKIIDSITKEEYCINKYRVENILAFLNVLEGSIYWLPNTENTFQDEAVAVPTEGLPYEAIEVSWKKLISNTDYLYNILPSDLKNLLDKWGNLLSKSIGVEYETSRGVLSDQLCDNLGLIKLRDGSLKGGFEYSTIPFCGGKALFFNAFIPQVLKYNHEINHFCSLHVHLGGFPREKKKILSLYLLLYRLQQEINEFIPPYRKTPEFLRDVVLVNGKDYCANLPSLGINNIDLEQDWENAFQKFFIFLTSGSSENENYNFENGIHPVRQKYNRKARYHNYNLLPMVFGKTETVEARVHTPTLNPYKIIAWIFINNAILEFVEKNEERILSKEKIDILDILAIYRSKGEEGEQMFNFLFQYITERKNIFEENFIFKHKYYPSYEEFNFDSIFVPKYIPDELQTIFTTIGKISTGEISTS